MAAFDYVVLDNKGRQRKGILEGDSARQIRQQLREQGLIPLTVELTAQKETTMTSSGRRISRQRITTADLSLLTRQLATLIQAGLPVEEALKAVAQQTEKPKTRSMILAIRARVLEGFTLANSLNEYPHAFPELYRATVASGEHAGHLDLVLEQLADYIERSHDTQRKVKSALIYPGVISCFSIGIVILLMRFVIPKMTSVFENSGQTLPLLTRLLIGTSEWLGHYGLYVLLFGIIALMTFYQGLKQPAFRQRVHSIVLTIPLIGRVIKGLNAARVASTLSILSRSGVQLVDALRIAAQVTTNVCIRAAVEKTADKVREGSSLHKSLGQSDYFPSMMIQMIASGEASGELDRMLDRAAQNQERELESLVNTVVGLFEPLIMMFMGVVVLVIVLAIMMPIISMNQLVN